jgi:hypothetical protein
MARDWMDKWTFVSCPRCGAGIGVRCKTASGGPTTGTHSPRLALAMEARKRQDRAGGLDPKGDSAGPKDNAHD